MPRSSHVYVVLDYDALPLLPVATFTVKHELVTFLRKGKVTDWGVLRYQDGVPGSHRDITDSLTEEFGL